MEENKEVIVENDEAALDKELAETISAVNAGKELEQKAPVKTEDTSEETKTDATAEQASTAPGDEKKEEGYAFRIPNKGRFESDESYEKRIELLDLVKKRKLANSPEQHQNLSEQIRATKGQLKNLNGVDKVISPLNTVDSVVQPEEDEAIKADRERLKQLGGATKEDITEIIRQERIAADTKSTLEKFVERHPELKDADVREVFFDFVDSNYNWNGKTGKELMTVLELAQESMFKPSESIQERVLKGANVQEKINAMQFPGGTVAKSDYSPEMRKSINELVATGMSESKAAELLSE